MPSYFFKYSADIPVALYTPNFSPAHLLWLGSSLLLIFVSLSVYRRQPPQRRDRFLKTLAVLMVTAEVTLALWRLLIGHFDLRDSLPLHLCTISMFIELLAVFLKKTLLFKEFAYALSMPAALAALITPGWYAPFWSFYYLESAITHVMLVLIPVLFVWGDGFRPDYHKLPQVSLLFILLIAAAVASNAIFGSNYMFLSYVPADTTLVIFETWLGNPGYVLPELLLLMLIWTALYLPWTKTPHHPNTNSAY